MNVIRSILQAIGGLCVLAVLGFAVIFFTATGSAVVKDQPQTYENEIRTLILNNFKTLDFHQIKPLLSQEFAKEINPSTLEESLIKARLELGWINQIDGLQRYNVYTEAKNDTVHGEYTLNVDFAKGKGTIAMNVEKTEGKWVVHSFQIAKTFVN